MNIYFFPCVSIHHFAAKSCPCIICSLNCSPIHRFYYFLVVNYGTYDSSAPFSRLDKALKAASFILPTLEVSTLTTVQFVPCIWIVQTMGAHERVIGLSKCRKI